MPAPTRRLLRTTNTWPGFVDALAALLMVVIFVLLVFVVSQFYLRETLSEREGDLKNLQFRVDELAELLSLEREGGAALRQSIRDLSAELSQSVTARTALEARIEAAQASLETKDQALAALESDLTRSRDDVAALQASLRDTDAQRADADLKARTMERDLDEAQRLTARQQEEISLLNQRLGALKEQLATLSAQLDAARERDEASQVKIADLGRRLNVALAGKVQELSRYRSEFFGRLREVLGNKEGVRVVGDRFVFQSEVLFSSGSADLEATGEEQLTRFAQTLKEIARSIPEDIDWILRIDGHTDRVPIASLAYPSNWELSTARAMSVVTYLLGQGIPGQRLAVAGFGEHHPLVDGTGEAANQRNRRIEIKLTQR